jgi:PmbA protein
MDIKLFKDMLFKKAAEYGFSEYELYYDKSLVFDVRVFEKEIAQYKNAVLHGVGFRGLYHGKMGYSYSEKIESDIIDFLLSSAKENAEVMDEGEERLFKGSDSYPESKGVSPELNIPSAEEKINWAMLMEETALKEDKRVEGVDYSVVSNVQGDNYIANSYGLELSQENGYAIAYVIIRVKDGDDIKTGFEIYQGKDFKDFDPVQLSKKAVKKAVDSLGAKPCGSGKTDIILRNDMASELFSVFVQGFYGENVQKGFSLLKGKTGSKIAADIVHIKDVHYHEKSLADVSFDSEGVCAEDKIIVENGVLKGFMHNLKSALKEGVPPTGNGFKPSYKGSVSTSYTNFYMEPSDLDFEGLKKKLGKGLIITDLAGLHSGANAISGDFSLLAEGFLVEEGEIIRPVEQITIAGNFYDVLKNITAIGSDLRFEPGGAGGIGMPSLIVKDISVSGI